MAKKRFIDGLFSDSVAKKIENKIPTNLKKYIFPTLLSLFSLIVLWLLYYFFYDKFIQILIGFNSLITEDNNKNSITIYASLATVLSLFVLSYQTYRVAKSNKLLIEQEENTHRPVVVVIPVHEAIIQGKDTRFSAVSSQVFLEKIIPEVNKSVNSNDTKPLNGVIYQVYDINTNSYLFALKNIGGGIAVDVNVYTSNKKEGLEEDDEDILRNRKGIVMDRVHTPMAKDSIVFVYKDDSYKDINFKKDLYIKICFSSLLTNKRHKLYAYGKIRKYKKLSNIGVPSGIFGYYVTVFTSYYEYGKIP